MLQYFPGLVNTKRFIIGGGFASNPGYSTLSSPVNQTGSTSSPSNTLNLSYLRDHTFNGILYARAYIDGTTGVSGGFKVQSVGATV